MDTIKSGRILFLHLEGSKVKLRQIYAGNTCIFNFLSNQSLYLHIETGKM